MFKRLITVLTIVSILCSVFALGFTAAASYADETMYGDVDGDGGMVMMVVMMVMLMV